MPRNLVLRVLCSQRRAGRRTQSCVMLHAFLTASLLCRLDELNLSWCFDFTEKHVQVAAAHISETVTQLNLSGYRKNLQRSGKLGALGLDSGGSVH